MASPAVSQNLMRTVEGTGLKRTLHEAKRDTALGQGRNWIEEGLQSCVWINCIKYERKREKNPPYLNKKVGLSKRTKRETQSQWLSLV